jgi:DNA-binding NarL/FixJ family response regulator
MGLKLLLADDHVVVREGFKNLLVDTGFEIVAEVSNGREAVDLAKKLQPHVALLDFAMPLLNGIDAARAIHIESPRTKTVLLTMHKEEQYVLEALRAGIKGYVLKSQAVADLIQAIQSSFQGETYLSPSISGGVVNAALAGDTSRLDPLTQREREILQLVAEGHSNKEVAQRLDLSVKTVESHRRNLMVKLSIHETAGLVRHAMKLGLVQL